MKYATLKSLRTLCLAPLAVICLMSTAHAQIAGSITPSTNMPQRQMQLSAAGSHDMKSSMMMNMEKMQKMPMSGDVDKDFAMMMKMHHQHALDMAQMELAHGKSPELKAMAKKIISGQTKEIAQLDHWLNKHK